MCGISGIWHLDNSRSISPSLIAQMTFTLRHRGPDDEGYLFVDTVTGHHEGRRGRDTVPELQMPDVRQGSEKRYDLAFGFRRLSIIDLSPAGHQPMGNADGSLWVVYNGEIYNYLELREELKARGHTFRTATDTEVILCAYEEWGEACLERFNGMWAFALWDGHRQQLFCARDRFGIKPFYYVWDGTTFAFASEIKALLQMPDITRRPNEPVIYDYLRYGHLDHSEETFFTGIKQFPPAHFLLLRPTRQFSLRRYWDLIPDRRAEPLFTSDASYAERFYSLFEDAVRLRLRSDVPIGTCLSGGLDSSAIVCVANKLLLDENVIDPDLVGERQRTFSSCFDDRQYDERQYIQAVLALTGAEPNYTFPKGGELLDALTKLMWHQDEPFGSTSIYAQWRVMEKTAERGVKVLLDGQGGDELLAG
jgi:asparagine synthase (glutamine-hydrolysing)